MLLLLNLLSVVIMFFYFGICFVEGVNVLEGCSIVVLFCVIGVLFIDVEDYV